MIVETKYRACLGEPGNFYLDLWLNLSCVKLSSSILCVNYNTILIAGRKNL